MRLGKYTYERRAFGQAEGAHKCCASARRSQKPMKTLAVFIESEALCAAMCVQKRAEQMQTVQIQPEAVETYCERMYLCRAKRSALLCAFLTYSAYSLIISSSLAIFSFI